MPTLKLSLLYLVTAMLPGCYDITFGGRVIRSGQIPEEILRMVLQYLSPDDFIQLTIAYQNSRYSEYVDGQITDIAIMRMLRGDALRSPKHIMDLIPLLAASTVDFEHYYEQQIGYPQGFFEAAYDKRPSTPIRRVHMDDEGFDSPSKADHHREVVPYSPLVLYDDYALKVDKAAEKAFPELFPNARHLVAEEAGRKINIATLSYEVSCHIWYDLDAPEPLPPNRFSLKRIPMRVRFDRPIRREHRIDLHQAIDWQLVDEDWYPFTGEIVLKPNLEPAVIMGEGALFRHGTAYKWLTAEYKMSGVPREWFMGISEDWYAHHGLMNRMRWKTRQYSMMMQ